MELTISNQQGGKDFLRRETIKQLSNFVFYFLCLFYVWNFHLGLKIGV